MLIVLLFDDFMCYMVGGSSVDLGCDTTFLGFV